MEEGNPVTRERNLKVREYCRFTEWRYRMTTGFSRGSTSAVGAGRNYRLGLAFSAALVICLSLSAAAPAKAVPNTSYDLYFYDTSMTLVASEYTLCYSGFRYKEGDQTLAWPGYWDRITWNCIDGSAEHCWGTVTENGGLVTTACEIWSTTSTIFGKGIFELRSRGDIRPMHG
jgi:hypothetical protein